MFSLVRVAREGSEHVTPSLRLSAHTRGRAPAPLRVPVEPELSHTRARFTAHCIAARACARVSVNE